MRCIILQRTPFPGSWEVIPRWQLEAAEWELQFNRNYYYERAEKRGDLLLYTQEDAQRIVAYWQWRYPFAQFMIEPTGA